MQTSDTTFRLNDKIAQMFRIRFITQAEVARKLGLDRSTLNRYLRGEADIGSLKLIAILREFEIDLHRLIDSKVDECLGRYRSEPSVGNAIESALDAMDPISQKAILTTIVNKVEEKTKTKLQEEREVIKKRLTNIRTVRRDNA